MKNFRDISALHDVLRAFYEKVAPETRCAVLSEALVGWGFTTDQASLFANTVLRQNKEGSADWVRSNALNLNGPWVRGEQQGMAAGWLNTMKETWRFDLDLTYQHKIEKYEGYSTGPSPFFQASYSRPSIDTERGIWAPPDTTDPQLAIFTMAQSGSVHILKFEWVDNANYDYRACLIDGNRFSKQW